MQEFEVIGTHSGPFHADDVLAVAAITVTKPARIIRSRDPQVLKAASILVDVGGVYDPEKMIFDHHFVGSPVGPLGCRLSSAGMVWIHFGKDILKALGMPQEIFQAVYQELFAPVDALDNGEANLMATSVVKHATFSGTISNFNPNWDEEQDFDGAFEEAVDFARTVLKRVIKNASSEFSARSLVLDACKGDPQIAVLDQYLPWLDVVVSETKTTKYVVFPSNGTWMVQCVPPEAGSFAQRLPLPENWAGLRGEVFQQITGVPGSVFCHPGRFICGADSKEGALRLAKLALS